MNKSSTRYFSNKQEKQIAYKLKGHKQANSGATNFVKGDVILDDWLIEAKTAVTEKQSFSIKKQWIEKNKEEAFAMNKSHQAIVFNFGGDNTTFDDNYFIISASDFELFINLLNKER